MQWKVFAQVFGAGAIGGLASWCVQLLIGVSPYSRPAYVILPLLIVVGGIAAALGVFLIANSDTTQLKHTLAFAVACGIFWQPVIQSARSFVVQTSTASQTASLQTANSEVGKAASSDVGNLPSKVAMASKLTTDLLSKVPATADSDLKAGVVAESTRSVDQIVAATPKAPEESLTALQAIGEAAVKSNQTELANRVLYKLEAISTQNPQLAERAKVASSGIMTVARQPAQDLHGAQKF